MGLNEIVKQFAESGWDLIDKPAKEWLEKNDDNSKAALVKALETAEKECGSCGCSFDSLYKEALSALK
ncbi:MAG: hypothetical protein FWE36_07875 [Erysipelotrichales bacterium]|nr:hypothetical protein [Erysipelotrichales bacterium]